MCDMKVLLRLSCMRLAERTHLFYYNSSSGRPALIIIESSGFEPRPPHSFSIIASVAQWVEHQTLNLGVTGSSPVLGLLCCGSSTGRALDF
jgi:hypothetical protein